MKTICDISDYKSNDIVNKKNIDEILKLQSQLWNSVKYYFDTKKAKKILKFSRKLNPDKGKLANSKLSLCVFQFQVVTDILCVIRKSDNRRRFREAHINMARKNGKSFIIGFINDYMFFFENETGGVFLIASVTRDLAGELYNQILHFIENTPLRAFCKITKSKKEITVAENNTKIKVISSDAAGANSYADYVFILDEIHEMHNQDLYSRLITGQGSFDQPLAVTISTASDGEDITNLEYEKYNYAKEIETGNIKDDSFYYAIYEADANCEVDDETQWLKANPGLDVFRMRDDIVMLSKRAKHSKIVERFFRRFILNQHVSAEIKSAINMDLWDSCTQEINFDDIKFLPNTAGLDLSSSSDITGFVQLFRDEINDKYIVYPHLFVPCERLVDKEKEDRVPYSQWEKLGYIHTFDGMYINYNKTEKYILNNSINNELLAFDRWGSPAVKEKLENNFNMLDFGQGYRSMSPAINTFEELLMDKKIVIAKNPCLRWMAQNVVATVDDAGNIKYSKNKSRKKIDGIIAMVMAIGAMFADKEYDTEKGMQNFFKLMEGDK